MRGRRYKHCAPLLIFGIIVAILVFSKTTNEVKENRASESDSNFNFEGPPAIPREDETSADIERRITEKIDKKDKAADKEKITDKEKATDKKRDTDKKKSATVDDDTCYGLCSPEKDVSQADYVATSVQQYLSESRKAKNVIEKAAAVDVDSRKTRRRNWVLNEASLSEMGTQPKMIFRLTMAGGQNRTAVFKPKLYSRDWTSDVSCHGFDRHNAELGAYYLRRTMSNFVKTSRVDGVRLNLKHDLWPIRDHHLKENSWVGEDGRYCLKIECTYCSGLVVCGEGQGRKKSTIDGSVSFWSTKKLKTIENPWSATCTHKGKEEWRSNAALCRKIMSTDNFFRNPKTLLDVIDAGVFDFLIDNPDRHHFEYWENATDKGFVLLDNGKAFSHPTHDDLNILASLFQCCLIKENTLALLRRFSDAAVFTSAFKSFMTSDPIFPFLDERHVVAVARRMKKVLAVVQLCVDKYGSDAVIAK